MLVCHSRTQTKTANVPICGSFYHHLPPKHPTEPPVVASRQKHMPRAAVPTNERTIEYEQQDTNEPYVSVCMYIWYRWKEERQCVRSKITMICDNILQWIFECGYEQSSTIFHPLSDIGKTDESVSMCLLQTSWWNGKHYWIIRSAPCGTTPIESVSWLVWLHGGHRCVRDLCLVYFNCK
jgi:hypothetical protein